MGIIKWLEKNETIAKKDEEAEEKKLFFGRFGFCKHSNSEWF